MYGKTKLTTLVFAGILVLILPANLARAQQAETQLAKDSDFDGVSDQAEINVYHTNPNNPDSDGDKAIDSQELIAGTDPNDPNSSPISDLRKAKETPAPVMWYVGRIAGISAFIMFTAVVCMGLLMTSKLLLKFRFLSASDALEAHSFNATFIGLALVVVHFVAFMWDDVIKLNILEVLVPFVVKRQYIKSAIGLEIGLPIALGIIAFYLAVVLVITSQFRNKIVSGIAWRRIHYMSFVFYMLFILHGFFTGSDSKQWWMQIIYVTSVILVVGLALLRIFGKKYFLPKPRVSTPPTAQLTADEEGGKVL